METAYIAPDVILSIISGNEKTKEVLNREVIDLVTSDFALYEALASITKEELDLNQLLELLYRVKVIPAPMKLICTEERATHLRKIAKLGEKNG